MSTVIKSRIMRWLGLVALMRERSGAYRLWWGDLRKIDRLEKLGVDERIILKWMFRNCYHKVLTVLLCLRVGIGGSTCECGVEPSGSIKCNGFID